MERGLDEVADALYAQQPQEFVAGRDAAVAEAKAGGDAVLASAIAKLRKPTVGAWLVNQLALKRPDAVRDLLELGDSLREAQRRLKGAQLRQLAAQRRAVIGALVGQAQELALAAQPGTSAAKLPLTEVEATLTAALADDEIAEQVRAGRLVKMVSYAGFGDLAALGDSDAADEGNDRGAAEKSTARGAATTREEHKRREAEEREARKELEAARRAEDQAREEFKAAEAAQEETAERLAGLEEEIEELERQRDAARKELQQAKSAQKVAQRALQTATRRVAQAEAALE